MKELADFSWHLISRIMVVGFNFLNLRFPTCKLGAIMVFSLLSKVILISESNSALLTKIMNEYCQPFIKCSFSPNPLTFSLLVPLLASLLGKERHFGQRLFLEHLGFDYGPMVCSDRAVILSQFSEHMVSTCVSSSEVNMSYFEAIWFIYGILFGVFMIWDCDFHCLVNNF